MPRKKLSEYRAKTIVAEALGINYIGYSIDATAPLTQQLKAIAGSDPFVLKVDQGVKGRYKKGLVLLNLNRGELSLSIKRLHAKGYQWQIVEPMVPHDAAAERYLSILQDRRGLTLTFSDRGGVNV